MRYNAWIIHIGWPAMLWPFKLSWYNKRIIEWKLQVNQMVLSTNKFNQENIVLNSCIWFFVVQKSWIKDMKSFVRKMGIKSTFLF